MSKGKKKSKRHGHYCRICSNCRPNEKFSRKDRRTHICQDCQKLPKAERNAVDEKSEIYNFDPDTEVTSQFDEWTKSPVREDRLEDIPF